MESKQRKVLVVGSGGREHALAWKLSLSPQVGEILLAPGNDGMEAHLQKCANGGLKVRRIPFSMQPDGFQGFAEKCQQEAVDLVVVGPDNPLADGIVDVLSGKGVRVFGPNRASAQMEASKAFSKQVMREAGVLTAEFGVFEDPEEALAFLHSQDWDRSGWVVKADGLALGKGVRVCANLPEAEGAVKELYPISGKLVIEERLQGPEISWMAFCDGDACVLLDPARDYKRIGEGDRGPNTGGMGAYSPVPEFLSGGIPERVKREIFLPVLRKLLSRGIHYRGILYAGILVQQGTGKMYVLEFNSRFGDPEAQVLLPRMKGDLFPWLMAVAEGSLAQMPAQLPFIPESAVYVVGAAPGYPDAPEKGLRFRNWDEGLGKVSGQDPGFFFAGVKKNGQGWVSAGGRVFGALGVGVDLIRAKQAALNRFSSLSFERMVYRRDIAG